MHYWINTANYTNLKEQYCTVQSGFYRNAILVKYICIRDVSLGSGTIIGHFMRLLCLSIIKLSFNKKFTIYFVHFGGREGPLYVWIITLSLTYLPVFATNPQTAGKTNWTFK